MIIFPSAMETYENYKSRQKGGDGETEDEMQPEFLIIGNDVSETDAIALNVPIRPGPNNEMYIWLDDISPN